MAVGHERSYASCPGSLGRFAALTSYVRRERASERTLSLASTRVDRGCAGLRVIGCCARTDNLRVRVVGPALHTCRHPAQPVKYEYLVQWDASSDEGLAKYPGMLSMDMHVEAALSRGLTWTQGDLGRGSYVHVWGSRTLNTLMAGLGRTGAPVGGFPLWRDPAPLVLLRAVWGLNTRGIH